MYEVLTQTLTDVFPTVEDPDDSRVEEFISSYRNNPRQAKFIGLLDQIEAVIQAPSTYLPTAIAILGKEDMTPSELRGYMVDLYRNMAGEDPEIEEAKKSPQKLFSYYASDRFQIPGTNKLTPPTWAIALGGLGSAFLLSLLYNHFLQGIPIISNIALTVIIILGAIGFIAVLAMYFLRNTVVKDNKRREREIARQERTQLRRQIQQDARQGRL